MLAYGADEVEWHRAAGIQDMALCLNRVSLFDYPTTPRYVKYVMQLLPHSSHQVRNSLGPRTPYDGLVWQSSPKGCKHLQLVLLLIYIRNVYEAHHAGITDILLGIFRVGVYDGKDRILHLRGWSNFVEDGGGAIFCHVARQQ